MKLKLAQYGCGKMSAYTMRYAEEKGCEIVAAFDIDPALVGKDISAVLGGAERGVKIYHAAEAGGVLDETKPAACIITTMSLMHDVYDAFRVCAEHGVNAISTCEEAFFPWNSAKNTTERLDHIAKEHHCTLCGSGYQDVFWGNLIATLAGATHKLTKIKGVSSYNVEDYGIALARVHGAGLSIPDFEREIASADRVSDEERMNLIRDEQFLPSYMWSVNGWLCSRLGLTVTAQRQKCVPHVYSEDIYSETLQMKIPKGYATGMAAVVTTETAEGILLETECVGKVYGPDEEDFNHWTLFGEPDTELIIPMPATVELTCATVVNRLPDLICAPYGFVTTDQMGICQYRSRDLGTYLC